MNLRPYQENAVAQTFQSWEKDRSVLGVAPTGAGKTQIFCEIIKRSAPARALILCHRDELVQQAWHRLAAFGIHAEIEKAELRAGNSLWNRAPVVVATPQTLYSQNNARLKRWKPDDFALLICDEAHHYSGAPAFEGIVNHFKQNDDLRVLGVTATADRHDNIALAKIFDAVAFNIELLELIADGYLVRPRAHMARIESLDLSGCRVTAGDLNGRDLAEVMEFEKTLLGVADATIQTVGTRRSLVFTASVKQAERLSEIFNRHAPNTAAFISGKTPESDRRRLLREFAAGKIRTMCNCAVLTEGFDDPGIEALVMAKPTKSRSLYCQMLGRGLRPLDGLIHDGLTTADDRLAAIAGSGKPHILILDFVGNAGRHKLVHPDDILGGKFSEEAKAAARKKLERGGDVLDELDKAERELREQAEAAKRAHLKARAQFTLTYVDLLGEFQRQKEQWRGHRQKFLSQKQRERLLKNGWNPDEHSLAESVARHKELIAATPKQRGFLRYMGAPQEIYTDPNLVTWEASKLIDVCVRNGKRWPTPTLEMANEN